MAQADPSVLPPPRAVPPGAQAPGIAEQPGAERAILLGAARTAVRLNDLDLAIRRFDEYIRRFPDDRAVRREYAGILVRAGQRRKAVEQYQALIEQAPDDVEARLGLADVLVAGKEYRQAIATLKRALELAPDNRDVLVKLARAYAYDGDTTKAAALYDCSLASIKPGDDKVSAELAGLLLDIQRPGDALAFLLPLREKKPDDTDVLSLLVRAYARLGERGKAIETAQTLIAKKPDATADRLDLAATLVKSGDAEVAGFLYQQILQADAGNVAAQIGTARVELYFYHPAVAYKILTGLRPDSANERDYLLTRAEYHQQVGETGEAKQVYKDLLHQNCDDTEARLALAAVLEFTAEYEKARAEYCKVPPTGASGRKARLGVASVLAAQRWFGKAIEICQKLLEEDAGDAGAMDLLARTLAKAGDCPKGEAVARAFLSCQGRNEASAVTVGVALGRVLREAAKFADAAHEYERLLGRPAGRLPAVYFGLARALKKLGSADKAQEALANVTSLLGGDTRNRLILADHFYDERDDDATVEMCQAVLKFDGDNLPALIRLADAQLRLARFSGNVHDTVATARHILDLSPTNVRGHLALARALATVKDYKGSVVEYDRIIAADADFLVPRVEKARVLYSDYQWDASAAAYRQVQIPSADDWLQNALGGLAQKDPRGGAALAPYLAAHLPGKSCEDELAKLAPGLDADLQQGMRCIVLDYEARAAEQNAVALEAKAKDKKGWRDYEAVPLYKNLIAVQPANTEGLFDLGQTYGTLKQTRHAIEAFSQTLAVDPLNRDASVALERAGLELNPQLRPTFEFFNQRGFGQLSNISRFRYGGFLTYPFGDENESVTVGYERALYVPIRGQGQQLEGNIYTFGASKKCDERLIFFGTGHVEQYEDRLQNRVTYQAGAAYDCSDLVRVHADHFLENVLENGETLRQDIHRLGINAGADLHINRLWNAGANYRFAYYSDHNDLHEMYLTTEWKIMLPPCQLKVVLDYDYLWYARGTVYPFNDPNILIGAIHPYFAPNGFGFGEARIEWTQWLSRDFFVYSNQCWYSLQYALGFDSSLATYNSVRAVANFDVKPWLTIGADAKGIFSPVYNAEGVSAFVLLRLPYKPW